MIATVIITVWKIAFVFLLLVRVLHGAARLVDPERHSRWAARAMWGAFGGATVATWWLVVAVFPSHVDLPEVPLAAFSQRVELLPD